MFEWVLNTSLSTLNVQKRSSGGVPKNFAKLTGKHLCQSLFFNKIEGLKHMCFSVNFAKFLRTPFLQNICGRPLLNVETISGPSSDPQINVPFWSDFLDLGIECSENTIWENPLERFYGAYNFELTKKGLERSFSVSPQMAF